MTHRDVYIGELGPDGALDWGGDPRTGNVPKRLGPFILSSGAHDRLLDAIASGKFDGKKVDWGAHAARVTVRQIREFLAACKDSGPSPGDLEDFLTTLDPTRSYALVAAEL
jgi:hypothetical protein